MGDMPEKVWVSAHEKKNHGSILTSTALTLHIDSGNGRRLLYERHPFHREDTCTANKAKLREKIEALYEQAAKDWEVPANQAYSKVLALLDAENTARPEEG